jgi:hypothetical protein
VTICRGGLGFGLPAYPSGFYGASMTCEGYALGLAWVVLWARSFGCLLLLAIHERILLLDAQGV